MASKNKSCVVYVTDSTGATSRLHEELVNKYGRDQGSYLMEAYLRLRPKPTQNSPYLVANEPSLTTFESDPQIQQLLANDSKTYAALQAIDSQVDSVNSGVNYLNSLAQDTLATVDSNEKYKKYRAYKSSKDALRRIIDDAANLTSDQKKSLKKIIKDVNNTPAMKTYRDELRKTLLDISANSANKMNTNAKWTQSDIQDALTTIDDDANWWTRLFRNMAQTSNQVLQVLQQTTQRAFSEASVNFTQSTGPVIEAWQAYKSSRSSSSFAKAQDFYKPLLEHDASGRTTGRLVSRYTSEYNDALDRLADLKKLDPDLYAKEYTSFESKFMQNGQVKQQYVSKELAQLQQDKEAYALYKALEDNYLKLQQVLPNYAKLGYKLPQGTKSFQESAGQTNLKSWESVKTLFTDAVPDVEESMLNSFIRRTEGRQIPILYTENVSEDKLSYDVMNNMLGFFRSAERYKSLSKIETQLLATKKTLARADVMKTSKFGSMKKVKSVQEAGKDSNTYKMLSSFIDSVLYGQKYVNETNSNIAQKIAMIKKPLDVWAFGINPISPAVGITFAGVNTLSEKISTTLGSIGSSYYNMRDLLDAEIEVDTDGINLVNDMMSGKEKSKTMVLLRYFGIDMSKAYDANILARTLDLNTSFALARAGSHFNEAVVLNAILRGQKVVNPTTGESVSLRDAIEVKNGKVSQKFKFNIDPVQINLYHSNIMTEFNYRKSSTTDSESSRYAIGKLSGFFRSFFIPAFDSRFAFKRDKKTGSWKPYYSQAQQREKIGSYIAAFNAIKGIGKDLGSLVHLTQPNNWKNFSEAEKKGIVRFATELGIWALAIATTKALSSALDVDLDDEEDRNTWTGQFVNMTARVGGETITFLNPATYVGGNGVIVNPFPLTNYVDRTRKWLMRDVAEIKIENDFDDFEIKEGELFE